MQNNINPNIPQQQLVRVEMMWIAFLSNQEKLFQFTSPSLESGKKDLIETKFDQVLQAEKQGKLRAFQIHSLDPNFNLEIGVSLETGFFNYNGIPKNEHPAELLDPEDRPFQDIQYRLVYYRRSRGKFGTDSGVRDLHIRRHLIGWQTTYHGKNYQRIAFFDPLSFLIRTKEKR